MATLDVAMNAEASAVEKALGKPIMSSLHGMFSVGGMFGAAVGGALLEAAKNKGLKVPFESETDERTAVVSISKSEIKNYLTTHKGKVKTVKVAGEEITRAGLLNNDSTGFLVEDMYWTDSFDVDHDK